MIHPVRAPTCLVNNALQRSSYPLPCFWAGPSSPKSHVNICLSCSLGSYYLWPCPQTPALAWPISPRSDHRKMSSLEFPTYGLEELKVPQVTPKASSLSLPPFPIGHTEDWPNLSPSAQQPRDLPCLLINATRSCLLPPGLFKSQMGMYSGLNNIMICKNHS